jgi:hypothetical protein
MPQTHLGRRYLLLLLSHVSAGLDTRRLPREPQQRQDTDRNHDSFEAFGGCFCIHFE